MIRVFASLACAIAAIVSLPACTSVSRTLPNEPVNQVGGHSGYGVVRFEGLSARDGLPQVAGAEWSPTQFNDLKELRASCKRQVEPMIPNAAKEISAAVSRPVVGSAVGTGLGAVAAFTGVNFVDYLKYGGLASLGGNAGSYTNQYQLAKGYVEYACMQFVVSEARRSQRLKGIGVVVRPFLTSGQGVPMPAGGRASAYPTEGRAPAEVTSAEDEFESDPALIP